MTKLSARRLGSRCRVTGECGRLGQEPLQLRRRSRELASQRHRPRRCGPRRRRWPLPPLSPLRAPSIVAERRRARVGAGAGAARAAAGGDSAQQLGSAAWGRFRPAARRRAPRHGALGPASTRGCREHAVRAGLAGRCGDVEAGIAGEAPAPPPPRRAGGRRRRDRGRAPRSAAARSRSPRSSASGWSVRASVHCSSAVAVRPAPTGAHQLRLGLDVQARSSTKRHLVAGAADAVERDLQRRRRRFACHPADPDPVRAVTVSSTVSIRAVTSGLA